MKRIRTLKILTGFTVGLAVCVAALFAYTIISPDKAEIKSADMEAAQEQRAEIIVEDVKQASLSVNIPRKSVKSIELGTSESYYETEAEEEYYEEYSEEAYYADSVESVGIDTDEYIEEYTESEYEDDYSDDWYDDSSDDWYDDSEDWYDDYEDYYEEPATNVPEPLLAGGNYTEGNLIAAQIAEYAETFVGVLPYNWAHHSLDPNEGADCSGFTHALYEAFGYDWLSYNDYGQSQQGRSVLYEEWLPGDILCFYGHVGIYVGDGMMVHCPDVGRYVEYCSATYNYPFDVRRMIE